MTDSTETDIAREIVTDWLGMFDPPPQIDFQQSEFLQQAIVFHLKKLRAANAALKQMVSDKDGLLTALRAECEVYTQALRQIYDELSSGDRATVNPENAFEHVTSLNKTLVGVRSVAKATLAVVATESGGAT